MAEIEIFPLMKKEISGALQRQQGGKPGKWKAYSYECKKGTLKEFSAGANPETSKPRKVTDLAGSYVEDGEGVIDKPHAFILNTKVESIYFLASSEGEKTKWMQTLGGRMSMRRASFAKVTPLLISRDAALNASSPPMSPMSPTLPTSPTSPTSPTPPTPPMSPMSPSPPMSPTSPTSLRSSTPPPMAPRPLKASLPMLRRSASFPSSLDFMALAASSKSSSSDTSAELLPLSSSSKPNPCQYSTSESFEFLSNISSGTLDPAPLIETRAAKPRKTKRPLSVNIPILRRDSIGNSLGTPRDCDSPTTPERGARMKFDNSVTIPQESYYVLESIRFSLLEGKNFKGKKKHNYYVNIYIDSVHKGQSPIQWNNPNPFWSENFLFEGVEDARTMNISVCNVGSKETRASSSVVGEADLCLATIGKGVNWVTLKAKNEKDYKSGEAPSISVEATKHRLKILPLKEYSEFLKAILEDDLAVPKLLAVCIGSGAKVEEMARSLLSVFILNEKVFYLATHLVTDEIRKTDTPQIMFRGNSLATKTVDLFMKEYGDLYLKLVLKGPIEAIYNEKYSCEVDPTRLEKITDLQGNRERLIEHVKAVWNAIRLSASLMPPELKLVFKSIRDEVMSHYPNVENLRYISVNGFIFLRFFCPAILNPYLFGLMEDHPDESSKRTLTLVAKTLQNLANLVEFGQKESYMVFLNTFLIDNKALLRMFVETICDVPDEVPNPPIPTSRYLNKELAFLYNLFQDYREKIHEHEEQHPDIKIKEFLRIFMRLDFTYSLYDKE